MTSGATPVISAKADAPHPNPDLTDPQYRWGAKKDAAYGLKSTRRPRCLCLSTTCYQERPGKLILDVFFSASAGFGRLTDWVMAVGLVFLVFFGINGYESFHLGLFDKRIAGTLFCRGVCFARVWRAHQFSAVFLVELVRQVFGDGVRFSVDAENLARYGPAARFVADFCKPQLLFAVPDDHK